jgi:hypothetical protein
MRTRRFRWFVYVPVATGTLLVLLLILTANSDLLMEGLGLGDDGRVGASNVLALFARLLIVLLILVIPSAHILALVMGALWMQRSVQASRIGVQLCPQCERDVLATWKVCPHCGEALRQRERHEE